MYPKMLFQLGRSQYKRIHYQIANTRSKLLNDPQQMVNIFGLLFLPTATLDFIGHPLDEEGSGMMFLFILNRGVYCRMKIPFNCWKGSEFALLYICVGCT